jgi:N-acetylglucosaminyldiphosphoundecaprenol N-acetyl-beta-D-mannosaminyltransferase
MSELRAELFGVPLDLLTMQQSLEECASLIDARVSAQHVVVNAGKYVMMADDPRLRAIVAGCTLVNADGMAVVWAGRILGLNVPERVTGIDLMEELLTVAESRGWPVYFLGATEDVLAMFLERVRTVHPELSVAGSRNGYFDDDSAVAASIANSGARLLFVAMPTPRKEYFLDEQMDGLGALLAVGVGGSFDVWAGLTRRAPLWMQRAGLEWLYRFAQEPTRMWRRYVVGNTRFLAMLARAWLVKVFRRG